MEAYQLKDCERTHFKQTKKFGPRPVDKKMSAVLGNWQWFFMAVVLPESGRTQGLILEK